MKIYCPKTQLWNNNVLIDSNCKKYLEIRQEWALFLQWCNLWIWNLKENVLINKIMRHHLSKLKFQSTFYDAVALLLPSTKKNLTLKVRFSTTREAISPNPHSISLIIEIRCASRMKSDITLSVIGGCAKSSVNQISLI